MTKHQQGLFCQVQNFHLPCYLQETNLMIGMIVQGSQKVCSTIHKQEPNQSLWFWNWRFWNNISFNIFADEKTAGHTLLSPKYSPVILPPVTSAKNSSPIVSPPSPVTFKSNSNISKKCSQQNQQQPKSLDLITVRPPQQLERPSSSTKRRGSRKSRSLRSTHLAMMSRPLVKSFAIDQEDSSHSSNSPSHKGDDGKKIIYLHTW